MCMRACPDIQPEDTGDRGLIAATAPRIIGHFRPDLRAEHLEAVMHARALVWRT